MNKIIWILWLQGRENAPEIVIRCIESWEYNNPSWEVRFLDEVTLQHYIEVDTFIDLSSKKITRTSFSDIVRIALLHEYGGVWADATTICNLPLDEWLIDMMSEGFFAFNLHDFPRPNRPLSSWFLAAKVGNNLVSKWANKVVKFWKTNTETDDYFWFHHLFYELLESDSIALRDWKRIPKLEADGPHSIQFKIGLNTPSIDAKNRVDWSVPLFKLTYRFKEEYLKSDTILKYLIDKCAPLYSKPTFEESKISTNKYCGSLKVSTQNCGDHIQLLAGSELMRRIGMETEFYVDRDDEIMSAEILHDYKTQVPLLINGWFKTNRDEWPPHRKFDSLFIGFHIRLHQCPELVSKSALDYYKKHEPIGCRDIYTHSLLQSNQIDSYVSHCLTLTFPRRILNTDKQGKIFVVSRDERILGLIPKFLGDVNFINHYSETNDFQENMNRATELLTYYKSEGKLLVTTLLHCALPAIAMGIPVVVIYPFNNKNGHISDQQRFSSLERLVKVYSPNQPNEIDWSGHVVDVSRIKISIIDKFIKQSKKWKTNIKTIGPFIDSSLLPVPKTDIWQEKRNAREILTAKFNSNSYYWGKSSSYNPNWIQRAKIAAAIIPNGVKVLEAGSGVGDFAKLISSRVNFQGSDLEPLNKNFLRLNLDVDEIPIPEVDYFVFLGVFEYLKYSQNAAIKICQVTQNIVCSYCCKKEEFSDSKFTNARRSRGWSTDLSKSEFLSHFYAHGFYLITETLLNSTPDFNQFIFYLKRF